MEILNLRTIFGPNVYQENPVFVMEMKLDDNNQGHEIESLVKSLSVKAQLPFKNVQLLKDRIVTEINHEEAGPYILEAAFDYFKSGDLDETAFVDEVNRLRQKSSMSPSSAAIVKAAEHRNIPWMRLKDKNLIQLGWGKYRKFIQAESALSSSVETLSTSQGNDVLDRVFNNHNGRIPVVAVTGTNGKTTCSRLLNHIFSTAGHCVGNTTSDGIFINNQLVEEGDTTGPISARMILSNPDVDIAVLETARGGIVKRGLAFDVCDAAIFTNVNEDHIGQDGIECIDDIIRIKSLIIKQVKKGGTVVLNADCKNVAGLVDDSQYKWNQKKIIFVSLDETNPVLQKHIKNNGRAYFYRHGSIIEVVDQNENVFVHTSDIPLTMNGTAEFHVWNSMATIAAAASMNVRQEDLLLALATFSQENNPGRTNLYRIQKGHLLLDFGHNPDAFEAIGKMASQWNVSRITGVIAAPGDRSDEMIRMTGEYAARAFEKIIVREDEDKRGRADGETSRLLIERIKEIRPDVSCRQVVQSVEALRTALDEMIENELVIFFYDFLSETDELLKEYKASSFVSGSLFKKEAHISADNFFLHAESTA